MTRLRREDGFALVLALACIVVFGILTAAAISYTTSNQQAAVQSGSDLQARQYAEAGLNDAYSTIVHTNAIGSDPTSASLLGTSASPLTFCITTTSCSNGGVGSASVAGCYGGVNGATCTGISPSAPASTWVISSTGYARKPDGTTISRSATAEVLVNPVNSGVVAAVWNHVFLTAPLVPNTCQTTFGAQSLTFNAPLYVSGNLCLTAQNSSIVENTQPVDLQVGGVLAMTAQNESIGSSGTPITSGVVVGGCSTSAPPWNSTTACGSTSYYHVRTTDTFAAQAAPAESATDEANDYAAFDPGPDHPCLAGTNPAPLNANQLDWSANGASEPDGSGSGSAGGSFDLTPSSSYACISQNGTSKGYLIWNSGSSSITVSGITVPAKTLAVNGSIFFDSNVNITHAATYTGTAALEAAGTITFTQQNVTLCATSACVHGSANWQGNSGNNSMLTLVSLIANNSQAIYFSGQSEQFQGSLWTQPSSTCKIGAQSATIEGPIVCGSMNIAAQSANLMPLPAIKNMPVGAPIPPNTGVTIGAPTYIK